LLKRSWVRYGLLGMQRSRGRTPGVESEPTAIRTLLEVSGAAAVPGASEHSDGLSQSEAQFLTSAAHIVESLCKDCEYRGWNNDSNGVPKSGAGDVFHDPALCKTTHRATHDAVLGFLCCCQDVAKWSAETNVVAVILAVRFSRRQSVNHGNWERVLLVALMVAQKLIDDFPLCKYAPTPCILLLVTVDHYYHSRQPHVHQHTNATTTHTLPACSHATRRVPLAGNQDFPVVFGMWDDYARSNRSRRPRSGRRAHRSRCPH
jgi:hypothetical protein